MRLVKLKLQNFRRFAGEHSLDLNDRLIALVGPNEAGKSSILDAISMVGRRVAPSSTDRTRGQDEPASISGLFVLDASERALLDGIPGAEAVTRAWFTISENERMVWSPERKPLRDLEPRQKAAEILASFEATQPLDKVVSTDEIPWDVGELSAAKNTLDTERDSLPAQSIELLRSLGDRLLRLELATEEQLDALDDAASEEHAAQEDAFKEARELVSRTLLELAKHEQEPSPTKRVIEALPDLPDVAYFSDQDRVLHRDYLVTEVADDPPPALANLCALAGVDLRATRDDLEEGRIPHVIRVFERANDQLRESFLATWNQSNVYPHLSTPTDGVLRIVIATEGGDDYSYPEERSDGLRWFIALHAFLVARSSSDPVLLVDEAETHLHYDAQADLIDALMSQRVASKVVYTTHSVGCLPPDFGCGIRAAVAVPNAERSTVANSYWTIGATPSERFGFTPLLFNMGAKLLPLTIPRLGLIVEGPSDAVLLPSLFREAAGTESIPYRVVPGLAELPFDELPETSLHAGRIAYLVDDDQSGRELRRRLDAAGVGADAVFDLSVVAAGATLEDLLARDVFAVAVNEEMDTWGLTEHRIDSQDVPPLGRWTWLKSWGEQRQIAVEALSKIRVCQRAVDTGRAARSDGASLPLLSADNVNGVRTLHEAILARLGASDARNVAD